MGDSSGEDNDPPRGAGGGKGGGKKYLALPFSPERPKGQSSVKSSNNSVINPTTVEETFADMSSPYNSSFLLLCSFSPCLLTQT